MLAEKKKKHGNEKMREYFARGHRQTTQAPAVKAGGT